MTFSRTWSSIDRFRVPVRVRPVFRLFVFHLNRLDLVRLIFAGFDQVVAVHQHADKAADGVFSAPKIIVRA